MPWSGEVVATIEKKIWPEYYDAIASGKKKYEIRLNDFEICEGDILLLKEWSPATSNYTGRSMKKKVTYVGKFLVGEGFLQTKDVMEKGIQVISLE